MVDAFGEVSFLTRSANRVRVLGALAERGRTEYELVEETGISDVTVGRILDDFRERNWVREAGDAYETTRLGDLLAEEYADFETAADLAARLGPVYEYLPVERMPFDLRLLAEGRVADPDRFGSLRAVDRWKQLLRESDRVVGVAPKATATTVVAEPFREAVVERGLTFRIVVSEPYYEAASARPEMCRLLREQLRGDMEMYVVWGVEDVEHVANFDEVATVAGYDESGNLRAGVETRAEPVHEWVRATYESYRAEAERLTPADFAD